MAKIIGLTGLAGAGKDTFARAMQRRFVTLGCEAPARLLHRVRQRL